MVDVVQQSAVGAVLRRTQLRWMKLGHPPGEPAKVSLRRGAVAAGDICPALRAHRVPARFVLVGRFYGRRLLTRVRARVRAGPRFTALRREHSCIDALLPGPRVGRWPVLPGLADGKNAGIGLANQPRVRRMVSRGLHDSDGCRVRVSEHCDPLR